MASGLVHRPDFEHLCSMAEVRGLRVGLSTGTKIRRPGAEQHRDLDSILIMREREVLGGIRIHRSIEAAARRALEVITSEHQH